MTSFQATLVNAGYGQLALRDQNGKIAQKWTLGAPKCVIGAHANCNVRCMLPGIADHHLLLVIGAKQIYMRALAAGVERDGIAVNELVLSGDHSQLAFSLAAHRFEYSRAHSKMPIAKPFAEDGASSPAKPEQAQDAPKGSQRLKFTFVQALEKNRDRSEAARIVAAAAEAAEGTSQRPAWVEEIVRDALRPVELRLETIAQPINNLERQLRRERARLRKRQQARKLSQHAAHEVGHSHAQDLLEAQETVQKTVADQSARLELVSERVSDIVSQLATLERIVSTENLQHRELANRTSQSNEEIVGLQREMLALVGVLQTRMTQPAVASDEELQWRAAIQRQLAELHQSLGILDEIKANLAVAIGQNRELSQDLQSRWQTLEELAQRPIVVPAAPNWPAADSTAELPAAGNLAASNQAPQATAPLSRFPMPLSDAAPASEQPIQPANNPSVFGDERAALQPTPLEPKALASTAFEPPAASRNFEVTDETSGGNSAPLPSWWTDDPVVSNEAYGSPDASRPSESPASTFSAAAAQHADLNPSVALDPSGPALSQQNPAADWPLTEYEQETGVRALPWSYGASAYTETKNDFPGLDVPQLLTSAISETPVSLQDSPLRNLDPTPAQSAYAQNKYAEQTFDELDDVRDVSKTVSQSTSQIEDQLQQWLSGDYNTAGRNRPVEIEGLSALEIQQAALEGRLTVDETYPAGGMLDQLSSAEPTAAGAVTDADQQEFVDHQEYAVSAFSAERLAIEEAQPESEPQYLDQAEVQAPHELPYQPADVSSPSYAPSHTGQSEAQSAADGNDESVEDYMRRLLARMRGVSESEVKLPGLDRAESEKPQSQLRSQSQSQSQSQSRSPQSSAGMTTSYDSNGSADTNSVAEAASEPFESDNYVPRVAAPEKDRDIDALRDLANSSARSAIHVSARRKHLTAIMIKSGVSLVGLAAGAALVSINGFQVNIGLIATLASFMVAIIWGYDALATLRPLLQASRAVKSQIVWSAIQEPESEAS